MILDTIVKRKVEEVAVLKSKGITIPDVFHDLEPDPPRGFRKAIVEYEGIAIIAEAKKASPSKGIICPDFDPVRIAKNYQDNGAQAISVLTDRDFFKGELLYLMQVRQAVRLPVLRKDFIIDNIQVEEAKAHGADAILLIAAILDEHQIRDFKQQAAEYGIDCLVEVHDEKELEKSLKSGADIVGINNRNLNNFSVDVKTTFRLKKLIPDDIPVVSESGLKSGEELKALKEKGIKGALIGETLMRAGETSSLLSELRK